MHFVKNANQMRLKASDSSFINTQRIYPSHEIINLFRPETPYNTCQQQISCGECESSEFHLSSVFLSVAAYYFRQYLYDLKASRILNQWHLEAKKKLKIQNTASAMTYNINAFGITLNPLSEKTLFIKNFSIYKLYKDRSSLERKLARKTG